MKGFSICIIEMFVESRVGVFVRRDWVEFGKEIGLGF